MTTFSTQPDQLAGNTSLNQRLNDMITNVSTEMCLYYRVSLSASRLLDNNATTLQGLGGDYFL